MENKEVTSWKTRLLLHRCRYHPKWDGNCCWVHLVRMIGKIRTCACAMIPRRMALVLSIVGVALVGMIVVVVVVGRRRGRGFVGRHGGATVTAGAAGGGGYVGRKESRRDWATKEELEHHVFQIFKQQRLVGGTFAASHFSKFLNSRGY
jgi:hypothetical protein